MRARNQLQPISSPTRRGAGMRQCVPVLHSRLPAGSWPEWNSVRLYMRKFRRHRPAVSREEEPDWASAFSRMGIGGLQSSDLSCKKIACAFFQIVRGTKRIEAPDESDVSATGGEFDIQAWIPQGDLPHFVENLRGEKGVVDRAQ